MDFRKLLGALASLWTPLIVVAAYAAYLFIVPQPEYESETVFFVKTSQANSGGAGDLFSAILQSSSNLSRADSEIVRDFFRSRDLYFHLAETFGLRDRWSEEWAGLAPDSSEADFLDHYLERVRVEISQIGIVTLRFRDSDPAAAQAMVAEMLEQAEAFLNRVGREMAEEQVRFAEQVVDRTEAELEERIAARNAYSSRFRTLDPEFEAQVSLETISRLEAELSNLTVERRQKAQFMAPDSSQLRALDARIEALRAELESVRDQLVEGQESFDEILLQYKKLEAAETFAQEAYRSALRSLETIRLDASRQISALIEIDDPALPEEADYPRYGYNLFTATLLIGLGYGLLRVMAKLAEEHN